tara:strand:- start:638 stop:856 length:219 start_codon:yes stop_codon:yes gene_type:complete
MDLDPSLALPVDACDQMLERARQHGEDGPFEDGATHEVGDLQGLFQEAWQFLSPSQRSHVWYSFWINFDDEE